MRVDYSIFQYSGGLARQRTARVGVLPQAEESGLFRVLLFLGCVQCDEGDCSGRSWRLTVGRWVRSRGEGTWRGGVEDMRGW